MTLSKLSPEEIVTLRNAGTTWHEIAFRAEMSREGVRQIYYKQLAESAKHVAFEKRKEHAITVDDIYVIRIDELELSTRTWNCLKNEFGKDVTIGTIREQTDTELLRLLNFGKKSLRELKIEIERIIKEKGLDR